MDKGEPRFKVGDKVNVKCSRGNDFPMSYVYKATILKAIYGADFVNHCWQYQVIFEDTDLPSRWFLEKLIKFPDEQFDAEVM